MATCSLEHHRLTGGVGGYNIYSVDLVHWPALWPTDKHEKHRPSLLST